MFISNQMKRIKVCLLDAANHSYTGNLPRYTGKLQIAIHFQSKPTLHHANKNHKEIGQFKYIPLLLKKAPCNSLSLKESFEQWLEKADQ